MRARVAHLAVGVDDARQDLLAEAQLLGEVDHRHPQAEDLGAALLDHLLRDDDVADRLRHLAAFEVDDEAVREHLRGTAAAPRVASATSSELWNQPRYWSLPSRYMSAGQRQVRSQRGSTASWLEPESNHTSRMSCSRSNDVPPHVGAGRARRAGTPRSGARTRRRRRAARRRRPRASTSAGVSTDSPHAVQSTAGNRHAPGALARDAPVGPVRHHVEDAVAAPGRNPLHRSMACCAAAAASAAPSSPRSPVAVHPDEPLRRRQEDHRVVAAPAVRVLVLEVLAVPQRAALVQRLARPSGWRRTPSGRQTAPTSSRKCPPGPIGA